LKPKRNKSSENFITRKKKKEIAARWIPLQQQPKSHRKNPSHIREWTVFRTPTNSFKYKHLHKRRFTLSDMKTVKRQYVHPHTVLTSIPNRLTLSLSTQVMVFWVVTLCSNMVGYQHSEHLAASILRVKIQATWSSEIGVVSQPKIP
jgi:hypothetical protein